MLFGRHRHGGSRDDRDCSDRRVRDNLCARGCAPTATDVRATQPYGKNFLDIQLLSKAPI